MIRKILVDGKFRADSGDLDTAFQLFDRGLVWDGDLVSKESRNQFCWNGYVVHAKGYQAMTAKGTIAYLTTPAVWVYLIKRWWRGL